MSAEEFVDPSVRDAETTGDAAPDVSPIDPQDQLRALLDHVPALVMTLALDGRILFVNRPHLGIPVEDIIGRSLFDFPAPAEERQKVRDAFAEVVRTGSGLDYESFLEHPAGTVHYFACRLGPILGGGRLIAVTLIVSDVTERKAVQRTVQESEERFRRIAEQSPDIIFRLGVNGLEYISPAFAAILGRQPRDRMTSTVMSPQHVHPDEYARLPEIMEQLDHGPVRYELRMLHADGHTLWTEHHLVPILSTSGKRIAVEGIVRDISERKQAEEALRQVHRELEARVVERTAELAHANQVLRAEITERLRAQEQLRQHQAALAHVLRVSTMGEMAAGLAHEINQPLGAIANFANGIATRLRAGVIQPQALLEAAERAAAEALRAGEVIRRLRDFVRRDDSKHERVDLNGVVREAAHLVESEARRAAIAMRLVLNGGLPEVEIDSIQVEQVLLNLMRNALEAMAGGEASDHELLIETAPGAAAGTLEVRVRDTGPGVPPAIADRVFDAFYTTKTSGLGMGLSISRSLIEDHGGRLWMRPNPDRGTTFGFTLPAAPKMRAAVARDASPAAGRSADDDDGVRANASGRTDPTMRG
jgi:PAS domain S-box-containing protein